MEKTKADLRNEIRDVRRAYVIAEPQERIVLKESHDRLMGMLRELDTM